MPGREVPADPILAAAHFLAVGRAHGWQRLLTEHVADTTGHCRSCRSDSSGGSPVWPCGLRLIAEHAEQLVGRRRNQRAAPASAPAGLPSTDATLRAAARLKLEQERWSR